MSEPSPDGSVETRDGRHVLRFERTLEHPIERVWAALTEPDELMGWLGSVDIDPVLGGSVELRWLNTDEHGNSAVLHGTITAFEAPSVLEIDSDIHGLLRWQLAAEGTACRLVFTSSIPAPNEYLPSLLSGWHSHLDFLADSLDGRPVDWPNWPFDHWRALNERYEASQT
jgi:uncharacterized protein YndB with AHSA1/START domain